MPGPSPNIWPKPRPINVQGRSFPPGEALNFDPEAFDQAIRTQGLTFVHWRARKCPIGVVDPDDERHPHGDHGDCSNGFLYEAVGPVTCLAMGNNVDPQMMEMGVISQSHLNVTFPRYYDLHNAEGEPQECLVAPFDRLYLAEASITTPNWQLMEVSGAASDRCDYPVVVVEGDIIDSLGRRYIGGQDFGITSEGRLHWIPGGKQPGRNADAGTGGVISVRYRYRPYWYISDMLHEIRVSQSEDPASGERQTLRLPQQARTQREYIFENQKNDGASKLAQPPAGTPGAAAESQTQSQSQLQTALGRSSLRKTMGPRDNGFGPR